jgi:hypothetical protein
MNEHSFTIESEDASKRIITANIYAGLIFNKGLYSPGYWYVMKYPERVQIKDMTSRHIIVSGFGIGSEGLPSQMEGWVSSEDDRYIEPGTYRRDFPEGCEMWCIRKAADPAITSAADLNIDYVKTVCLQPEETVNIPAKDNLFILNGSCRIGDKELIEEKHYYLGNEPRTITATAKTYLLYWPNLV